MATIKYKQNSTTYSCWSSTGRVTTPSLCFKDGSTTKYVPLFAVSNGSEGSSGNYYFKVGGLCAKYNGTTYRAALSRRYASSVSSTISTTITHSGKTGSTTTAVDKSVTKGPYYITADNFGLNYQTSYVTVNFGVTFKSAPSVSVDTTWFRVDTITTTSCRLYPSAYALQWYAAMLMQDAGPLAIVTLAQTGTNVTATGKVNQTTTTYPSETKSSTASGNFNYGVTYPSAPSLTVNSGGVSASNNSGNASFKASKSLSGTVEYGKSATLSQAFKVSFTGAI